MPTLGEAALRALLQLDGFVPHTIETSVGAVALLSTEDPQAPGPPIVLVHGFAASGLQLVPLARALRGRFRRVVIPDLPGHGFSAQPKRLDPETLTAGTLEALAVLSQPPAVFFGNSMGGLAVTRFAAHAPEGVLGLVLCSPGGAPQDDAALAALKRRFHLQSHEEALAFVDDLFGRRHPLRQLIALGVRRRLAEPQFATLMDGVMPEILLQSSELAQLKAPVLLIWGEKDGILPKAQRDFFEAELPAGTVVHRPPQLGHSPALGNEAEIAAWIEEFVTGLGKDERAPSQG